MGTSNDPHNDSYAVTDGKRCGTCGYCRLDIDKVGYYCNNKESEFYILETDTHSDACRFHKEVS